MFLELTIIASEGKNGKKLLVNMDNVTDIFPDGEGCQVYQTVRDEDGAPCSLRVAESLNIIKGMIYETDYNRHSYVSTQEGRQ